MDSNAILALAIVAGAVIFAVTYKPKPKVRPAAYATPMVRPGRALIDSFEESGKDSAGLIVEQKLGEQKAKEMIASLQSAFGVATPVDPKAPAAGSSPAA